MFLKLLVQVFTDSDVLEHPLQFGRVFEPTRLLQENKNRIRQFSVAVDVERTLRSSLQFVGAARCESDLEFGDHAGLRVVAGAVLMDQTLGQHLRVELLENIFVLDVLEHNHLEEENTDTP